MSNTATMTPTATPETQDTAAIDWRNALARDAATITPYAEALAQRQKELNGLNHRLTVEEGDLVQKQNRLAKLKTSLGAKLAEGRSTFETARANMRKLDAQIADSLRVIDTLASELIPTATQAADAARGTYPATSDAVRGSPEAL